MKSLCSDCLIEVWNLWTKSGFLHLNALPGVLYLIAEKLFYCSDISAMELICLKKNPLVLLFVHFRNHHTAIKHWWPASPGSHVSPMLFDWLHVWHIMWPASDHVSLLLHTFVFCFPESVLSLVRCCQIVFLNHAINLWSCTFSVFCSLLDLLFIFINVWLLIWPLLEFLLSLSMLRVFIYVIVLLLLLFWFGVCLFFSLMAAFLTYTAISSCLTFKNAAKSHKIQAELQNIRCA